MAGPASRMEGDQYVNGTLSCLNFTPPANCITDKAIPAAAGIQASKLVRHESINRELFGSAVTITALTQLLHLVRGATGTIVAVQAAIVTAATGSDRTVTVDLQKSTGGGAFATVLSGTIGFTHSSTPLTAAGGTISSASVVAGDILEVIVTVAGSASAQALGLIFTLTIEETYQ